MHGRFGEIAFPLVVIGLPIQVGILACANSVIKCTLKVQSILQSNFDPLCSQFVMNITLEFH